MALPVETRRYTIAEYLELEAKSQTKNEFHNGEILAMAGGTFEQSIIKSNLMRVLGNRLEGKGCRALDSDMRVRIAGRSTYVYPDATVLCGPPQFDADDHNRTTILNPKVVIEVLSDSTEAYDRGEKFSLYREIESLQEYVLVAQRSPRIEVFHRHPDGSWLFTHFSGIEAIAKIRCVGIELPLREVYAGLDFAGEQAG